MSKRTAIIDIGSNSARMAIFEKSSRFAFHLIHETKSRVRIGEGAYNFNGILQEPALKRAYIALEEFGHIIKSFKCTKTLCLATSALRDAPNASAFIRKIHSELNIQIKIIEGPKEAYYGAVGALNYLKELQDAVTIDIGGGSTELAKIENGTIVETISLNIGTVRLKELFFDKKIPLQNVRAFLHQEIEKIPQRFSAHAMIGIGGTLRSLSKIIMERMNYPLKTVHGFEYDVDEYTEFIDAIVNSDVLGLKDLGIRKDRLDTMREGCIIFQSIYQKFGISHIITSGAGIREGAYLCDLLRSCRHKFHPEFKLSLRSLKDRFSMTEKENLFIKQTALALFDALLPIHGISSDYKQELGVAAELHTIGTKLGFYQNQLHSFYFILNNLNYGFSHEQKMLIAMLVKYHVNKLPSVEDMLIYKALLPDIQTVQWLSFLLALSKAINSDLRQSPVVLSYQNHTLTIQSQSKLFLAKEQIKQLLKPASFAIIIKSL
ncbi:Ppx/GppA phosphatase family protein [Sulfurospirillum cavolei]|uniref:Ppx/GppA phosphatase family protein n=1 Tax=Sulfurospirillum cavolei TaxID=366522 RepID=UPI000764CC0F|nr:Ppx/GppA phosphatase family protein [Sulfurospirillum cavolei]